jgi:hypothetical protein
MSTEKLLARIETVRRKDWSRQRTAERRKPRMDPPSKNDAEASLTVQRYKSELAHLDDLGLEALARRESEMSPVGASTASSSEARRHTLRAAKLR